MLVVCWLCVGCVLVVVRCLLCVGCVLLWVLFCVGCCSLFVVCVVCFVLAPARCASFTSS